MHVLSNIDEVLDYLVRSVGNGVEYNYDTLVKVKNFLAKFIHCPKILSPEIRNYNTDALRMHKARKPYNRVINSKAYNIVMFDFDNVLVYFVSFGDIFENNTFDIEVDICDMTSLEIPSNSEAIELLSIYKSEVKYDEMNDAVNYHSTYRDMLDRKAILNSDIVRKFENFTI